MNRTHLKVTQAGLVSLFTIIVGQLVAFVPSFAPSEKVCISAGTAAISVAFLLANAVHHVAASNVSARDVEHGAINAAKTELAKVDVNQLLREAVSTQSLPQLEALAKQEAQSAVQDILSRLGQQPVPVAPAPVVPAPPGPAA